MPFCCVLFFQRREAEEEEVRKKHWICKASWFNVSLLCVVFSEVGGRGGGSKKGTHKNWICNASWLNAFLTCAVVSEAGGGRDVEEGMQILQSNTECWLNAAVVCLYFRELARRR